MKKFVSLIMSVIMAVTGFVTQIFPQAVSGICKSVLGISLSETDIDDSFLNTLTDFDTVELDGANGYLDDHILVFVKPGSGVIEKYRAFASVGAVAVGYLGPCDLYVLRTKTDSYAQLVEKCGVLNELDCITLASACFTHKYSEDYTPSDPFDIYNQWDEESPWGANWWLEAIEARSAWDYGEYMNKITVGIVDGGFCADHEELSDRLFFPNAAEKRKNISDDHGTHVAGIIAAKADNDTGISGVNPKASLCCVDWHPEDGQMWIPDVKILFSLGTVVRAGAKVINYSLGSAGSINEGSSEGSQVLLRLDGMLYSMSIASLLSKGYDFIVVQSAGNGNDAGRSVDAKYNGSFCAVTEQTAFTWMYGVSVRDVLDRIIVVGSARNKDSACFVQANSSNVGDRVSICAPGVNIYSCYPMDDGKYGYMSGTSMAAPVVTGVTSLVWSVNPSFTGAQVKNIVCDVKNTKYTVLRSENPYFASVPYRDYPLVNAKLAVEEAIRQTHSVGTVCGSAKYAFGGNMKGPITAVGTDKTYRFIADGAGDFSFLLPPGEYDITIGFLASHPFNAHITVSKGETVDITENIKEFYGLS